MTTTPEIICDLFSFLDKDQIERIQLVNQFWNNAIIRHKNILPLRKLLKLYFSHNEIYLYMTKKDNIYLCNYIINFDGTNLSKGISDIVQPQYSQLTVDEVLTNLNDVVFDTIDCNSDDNLLNMMKLVITKTGSRFRGKFGHCYFNTVDLDTVVGFESRLNEIFDNYIIVDVLTLNYPNWGITNSYIREVCANPEIVQLPSTSKEIRFSCLEFKENEEVLHFICNGKLNGANRLAIELKTADTNYGNFIRQWFELYRTHENPISLVGKFELIIYDYLSDNVKMLDVVKTFLNNNQLRVKYSLETKEFHRPTRFRAHSRQRSFVGVINQYVKRSCVLYETDSYALVIEMEYDVETDMSSIDASDLDQPPCDQMFRISFCVKLL